MHEETPVLLPKRSDPWKTIWFQPRATIRALVEHDPTHEVDRLAILMGMAQVLEVGDYAPTDLPSLLVRLAVAALLGPVIGLIGIRVGAFISGAVGRWLGGKATFEEICAAYAWAAVPRIAALPLQLLFLVMLPFFSATNPLLGLLLIILGGGLTLLAVWELVLTVITLSEVHRFSVGRAILTVLIPALAFGFLMFTCAYVGRF